MAVTMRTDNTYVNIPSILLSNEENEAVIRLLGHKCQALATAVIQLFLTDPPHHSQWRRRDAGVLCLVKDNTKRSYFFRIYCLSRQRLIWEHEVYNTLDYQAPCPWLHTFEAEDCMAAFNFANEDEARAVKRELLAKLEMKKQKRAERKSRQSMALGTGSSMPTTGGGYNMNHNGPVIPKNSSSKTFTGGRNKKDTLRKAKLTKADIGKPQDFRHVSHVGWDPNRGFDVDNVEDPSLKKLFEMAGISENQLRDKETRDFIYEFINQHGGIDAVKEDVKEMQQAPPVPARGPPPPVPNHSPTMFKPQPRAPPPPSQNAHRHQQNHSQNHGTPHQRTAPPPPPPPSSKPPSESSKNAPPPPPMPTAVSEVSGPPPPPPPPLSNIPKITDTRAAFLEEIRQNPKPLKPVDVENVEKKSLDSRDEMLKQITSGGFNLRHVPQSEKPSGPQPPTEGLAGALARALQERSRAFHNDSDSDSDSGNAGDSDSEWDE